MKFSRTWRWFFRRLGCSAETNLLQKTATSVMESCVTPLDALCDRPLSAVTLFYNRCGLFPACRLQWWPPLWGWQPRRGPFSAPTALNIDGLEREGWNLSPTVVWPSPIESLLCLQPVSFQFLSLLSQFISIPLLWLFECGRMKFSAASVAQCKETH